MSKLTSKQAPGWACAVLVVLGGALGARAESDPQPGEPLAGATRVLNIEGVSTGLRLIDLPTTRLWEPGDAIKEVPRRHPRRPTPPALGPLAPPDDPLLALQQRFALPLGDEDGATRAFGTPLVNIAAGGFSGVNPADPVGDIGLTHYVQMINFGSGSQIRVYNKSGALVAGPTALDSLAPVGSACATGAGDPIVIYDQYADRWILTEFGDVGNHLCVYYSATSDVLTTLWTLYDITTTDFPDYPKYGLMPNALYVGTNENVPRVYALQRSAMLSASPLTVIVRDITPLSGFGFQMLAPADADGIVPPPLGTPGIFARHVDTEAHGSPGSADRLELFLFQPNFASPAASTVTQVNINIAEISSDLCGLFTFSCIPQPSGSNALDPLREVVMNRLQYRNFGTHQVLVGSLATNLVASPGVRAGVRWFELRNTGTGWSLFQEGTFSPDTTNRWMPSAAMDGAGDLAIAYSVSSASVFPGLRYAGRTPGDAAGVLTLGEATLQAGSASNGSIRWGDYASLNVDPVDECTFWFTSKYAPSSSWATRLGAFRVDTCVPYVKGDLNQDLKTDLVFRNTGSGQNDIWLMNGTTRIGAPVTLSPTPSSLNQAIVGVDDFNSDNKNDLMLWNSSTGAVEFWTMNGTTRTGVVPLTGATALAINWKPSATADFNRDGKPDIVWRNVDSQKIVIWTMNDTVKVGNIIPTPDQAVDANWEIVAALDYDNDGYVDFLWYNPTSGKIVAWFMNAAVQRTSGNFTNPANAGDNNWRVVASGDYGIGPDGPDAAAPEPGSRDIVWRNATSGNIVVWHMDYARNRTGGVFTSPTAPSPTPTAWTIVGPR